MRVALSLALALLLSSCKPKAAPCTSMGASELVVRAAVVRLDVYPASAHCDGNTLQAGAPPPTQTVVVAAGHPIKLDVPSGRHVLLLTAFADAAATQLLGSACTEANLKTDEPACFNLTLDVPDGGGIGSVACSSPPDNCAVGSWCAPDGHCAPGCRANADCAATPATPFCVVADHRCVTCLSGGDCAPGKRCSPSGSCVDGCDLQAGATCPSPLMCCSQLCLDASQDILNCGGCGRACAAGVDKGVAAAACSGSLCTPRCRPGFADCTEPAAPADDDGCETNIYTPEHCGNCNTTCKLDHVDVNTCPAGTCQIGKCTASFTDCDSNPSNGCECSDIGDGSRGCCPTGPGCNYMHTTGFGQTYADCFPVATYTDQTAKDAATAFDPSAVKTDMGPGVFYSQCKVGTITQDVYCNLHGTVCACFTYHDSGSGAFVGKARKTDSGGACFCALGDKQDATWK
jgi:hypothetical protein